MTLRIMTLKISEGISESATRQNLLIAEAAERRPEVLCLQLPGEDTKWLERLSQVSALTPASRPFSHSVDNSQLVTLTSLPVFSRREIHLPQTPQAGFQGALMVKLKTAQGRPLVVLNASFAEGPRQEKMRLTQAEKLDELTHKLPAASDPESVMVLAGSLNSQPSSDTIRFLTGFGASGWGTCWTDATETSDCFTLDPLNPLMVKAARRQGVLEPSLMPQRQLDFVLVRGDVHGRPGSPLSARAAFKSTTQAAQAGDISVSERWGLEVDLWDPASSNQVLSESL